MFLFLEPVIDVDAFIHVITVITSKVSPDMTDDMMRRVSRLVNMIDFSKEVS